MDRSRPPWELHLIHGLEGGRLGLLTKVHHAAVDGVSGLELLGTLLDPSPDVRDVGISPTPAPRRTPEQLELLVHGLAAQSGQPARALRVVPNVLPNLDQMPMTRALPGAARLSSVVRLATSVLARGDDAGAHDRPRTRVPRTSFNGRISAQRRYAFDFLPLDAVRRISHTLATTVNDVVVALVSSALRSWLIERDELPAEPAARDGPGFDALAESRPCRGQSGLDDDRPNSHGRAGPRAPPRIRLRSDPVSQDTTPPAPGDVA